MGRRVYIDWLRGVAVLVMIEWHTIDAWTRLTVRDTPGYRLLMFLGGWAAPLFLFLAGVAIPLAAAAQIRKGQSPAAASWALQKRGWQIFGIALLFKFGSFVLTPTAGWESVLKVDILNVLGLGMVASAWCWGRGRRPAAIAAWLLVPAAACVLIGLLAPGWTWPTWLHPRLEGYIRPVGALANFSLFPWAGFVFFGAYVGHLIGVPRTDDQDRPFQLRFGLAGAAIAGLGAAAMFAPSPFPHAAFWTNSASFFLLRAGGMTIGLALAWLWLRRPTAAHWSPMVVFGRTSLFVYLVHVELAYGFATYPLHHRLPVPAALAAYVVFTAMMVWLASWWMKRPAGQPWIPTRLKVAGPNRPGLRRLSS
jgi:uncharacterized membrane protein